MKGPGKRERPREEMMKEGKLEASFRIELNTFLNLGNRKVEWTSTPRIPGAASRSKSLILKVAKVKKNCHRLSECNYKGT